VGLPGVTKSENHANWAESTFRLWIEYKIFIPEKSVTIGVRVGLNKTPEPWLSKPWRFLVKENVIASRTLAKQSPHK
jgi:3-methyladenine DNA glycosylase Mpg